MRSKCVCVFTREISLHRPLKSTRFVYMHVLDHKQIRKSSRDTRLFITSRFDYFATMRPPTPISSPPPPTIATTTLWRITCRDKFETTILLVCFSHCTANILNIETVFVFVNFLICVHCVFCLDG